ncbi:dihydroxyacetone kinase subunit DhaL [Streptococcus parauberis]|uniref:phosphoenolpyruvate--glycerone phosphotransferase n=2 Tax=Streptococcus parauberis TaxID=1348 RepID=A0A0E2U9F7_9STRE|nr:dihydroxyacetone kinase subunit DhaL [Streptococcus parauberis]AEF24797.1 dihydroxyacetone kinase family protein [Streptococcus parauberis KCTC 11537]EGE54918.1 dihydroxyacetone kinase, L subunit [Streptococcus parauberis NCFD 2020]EMF49371.1 Phosphoenolpyruvate-dihydroxyacetone phosphotransferase, ADP-binding subunit [Streptococcus parauberis KRS-02109]KYP17586.1 PTS-dependent dihydroxyacetone kinase, ADP-binding subunit DhaL [Streptococcus parauberis]KYP18759.1 PTS-dependent dihydroxyacet
MDLLKVKKWISNFNNKINDNKDYLSQLDTPIGDGDHGGNMARGMAAVVAELESKEFESSQDLFKMVAMQLLSKVGGASGPLYGSAFMGMAKADQNLPLAEILSEGLAMIQKRGKAEVGEKTMVDMWSPVVDALKAGNLSQEVIDQALEATKDIKATKGRASYVGERSVGHIDPGACSSSLLFKAMLEAEVE